jgi:hypothetical protein
MSGSLTSEQGGSSSGSGQEEDALREGIQLGSTVRKSGASCYSKEAATAILIFFACQIGRTCIRRVPIGDLLLKPDLHRLALRAVGLHLGGTLHVDSGFFCMHRPTLCT